MIERLSHLSVSALDQDEVIETSAGRGTYGGLQARGAEFAAPPAEWFYAVEAIVKDGSGNWFTLVQRATRG